MLEESKTKIAREILRQEEFIEIIFTERQYQDCLSAIIRVLDKNFHIKGETNGEF